MTWQAEPTMVDQTRTPPAPAGAGGAGRAFFRAPIARRTWACFGYLLIGAPLGVAGFAFTVTFLAAGVLAAITFLGLPLIGFTVLAGRRFGTLHRNLARKMIGARVDDPAPFQRRPGVLGWLSAALADGTGWRALVYLVLKFPVSVAGAFGACLVWVEAGFMVSYPVWWEAFHPMNKDSHGRMHHAGLQFGDFFFDTWPKALLVSAAGLVALFLGPWPVRGMAALDGVLIRRLLGPWKGSARVRELEEKRTHAVEDSAASLRRIERDLHDGTQARLVALAMRLGQARESEDPARMRELVDSAHDSAKDAIAELRDLVRGIYPPVLDQGLDAALATLAARSAVPVELHTHVPQRPSPAIETIAYFCVAELLTNIAKHSGARHATVHAGEHGGRLQLEVRDDGLGGARIGAGTGLSGLDERVRTVDGTLTVHSPPGGPTVIAVELPVGGSS
ncbi:MAG TPA: sensor domain-containing protein [Jatrophihabitantaceae bacterium]|nr:sensor domain-containing protein [Jatrophihabitantaceae bacterium]